MPQRRFGKHPPKTDYRTLRFKTYVTPTLAAPPKELSVLTRVYDKLHASDPTALYPMDGNDTLGDCTIAALAHAVTTFRGLLGQKDIMAKNANLKDPGEPSKYWDGSFAKANGS